MTSAPPTIRRINSVDSCDCFVRHVHGQCKRSGVWAHQWHAPDGRLVARSTFERRGFTNRIEVAPAGGALQESP